MALVHADPFAHYAGAQYLRVYPDSGTATGTPGAFNTGPFGRAGGAGFRLAGNFSDYLEIRGLSVSGATGIIEVDFRVSAIPPQDNVILTFLDGVDLQCSVALTTGLQLAVYRGGVVGGALLGTLNAYTLTLGTIVHLSWKATIGNSGSTVLQVWEDDDVAAGAELSLSGVDTQFTESAQWDGFQLGAACNGTTDWAHVVVMDGSTSFLNDLLGPVDVWALWANGRAVPATQGWSLSGGTSHEALIQDGIPDDDLTYVYESSAGAVELSYVDLVPFPDRDILGMQAYACVRKTDTNSPTVSPVVRDSGTNYTAGAQSPRSDYAYAMQPYSRMPSGATFSAAAFDALQWGLDKTA